MSKTISDLQGLAINNKVAITINFDDDKATTVSGRLSGIQTLPSSGQVGLCLKGLTQWIWIEDNMTVTWISEDN